MTMALVLTGLTAYYVAGNESLLYSIIGSRAVLLGMLIGEIALVWILSANIMRMSFPVAGSMFGLYSILNGLHHGERGYHLLCYGWHVWCNVIGRSFH